MPNKRIGSLLTLLALATIGAASPAAAQEREAEVALQQAMHVEQVEGDLELAIQLYRDIVAQHGNARNVAAKALLKLGQCYEKLGRTEATNAYQRLVREYGDQSEEAAEARARLAALSQHVAVAAPSGPAARMLLSSSNPADNIINGPGGLEPSPDGRWVAYAQTKGEDAGVYLRDLASGEVQQVAALDPTVDGNNWSVVWSRDGKRLAFGRTDAETGTTTINMLDLASRKADVVPGLDARGLRLLDWSLDGRYLLCNRRNTVELVTVEDGTMTVLADSTWTGQRASFSPDGRFVAFARGKYGSESVYTQALAGGPRHRIADAREGVYLHPLWSPDGSAIAYQQPDGIWVAPVTDGVASGTPRLAYRTESARWAIKWTESGRFFLTLNEVRIPIHQVAVDPTSGQIVSDTPQEIHETPDDLQWFSWSPDGRHMAFSGWHSKIRIYAADSKTMTAYDVGPGPAANARWSADGREIFYLTGDAGTRMAQMKALDVSSGEVRELFPPMPAPASFSLSADGRQWAFRRPVRGVADSGSNQFDVVVAETGQPDGRVVATIPAMGGMLLSPQGDQVVYNGKPGEVWVVASDGTGARRLLTDLSPIPRARASWDPSGRFIAYTTWTDSVSQTAVLRVVEVATGIERGSLPLGTGRIGVTEWSLDGRFIGLIRQIPWWEFWVVEGLLEEQR